MLTPVIQRTTPVLGAVVEVSYPFIRSTYRYTEQDFDGSSSGELPTWAPGTRFEERGACSYSHYTECVADAMGRMVLTVIDVHKPGRFPTRVFYTRQWIDPDGKRFGKGGKLRITTVDAFRRLSAGYRHEFELAKVGA